MLSATVKVIKRADYSKKLNEINRKFLPTAGKIVESTAKRYADGFSDSGRLRSSINTNVGRDEVTVGTNVEYAVYVEYGTGKYAEGGGGRKTPWVYYNWLKDKFYTTSGMKAQPFLRPALDVNRKGLIKLYAQIFRSVFSGS